MPITLQRAFILPLCSLGLWSTKRAWLAAPPMLPRTVRKMFTARTCVKPSERTKATMAGGVSARERSISARRPRWSARRAKGRVTRVLITMFTVEMKPHWALERWITSPVA